MLSQTGNIDEIYAYTFGSVGFVRFATRDAMFAFLKQMGTKEKPQINGRSLWISSSKSPEERAKSKNLSKFKKVLLDTELAKPEAVKVDYKRGIVLVHKNGDWKHRVAEWKQTEDGDKLIINPDVLRQVGIIVEPDKIYDAVAELLRN